VERAALRARDFDLDLASKAGSRLVVGGAAAPPSRQGGFYCAVCDCTLADSGSYLTHLNGRWHNRALGMSMTVERSTAAEVRDRLAAAAARKKARGGGGGGAGGPGADRGDELDRQLLLTAGPAKDEDSDEEEEAGAGVAVGKVGAGPAPRPVQPVPGGGVAAAAAAKPPPPAKAEVVEAEGEEADPMMAAMGFAGFGTSSGR
jgi:U4/U6.U5 tri-snRNP component SNU23